MKHFFLIFSLLLFTSLSGLAQPEQYTFGAGQFHFMEEAGDGDYLLLGSIGGQVALKKVDEAANVVWEQVYPLSDEEYVEYGHRLKVVDEDRILIAFPGTGYPAQKVVCSN